MDRERLNRRKFLQAIGAFSGLTVLAACTTPGGQSGSTPAQGTGGAPTTGGAPQAGATSGAGATPQTSAPGAQSKGGDVKLGQVWPMTGSLAPDGARIRNAVVYAVDEINEAGGIKSLGGAKITLLDGDSEGKPDVAVAQTERLIREGAHTIIGAYTSAMTLATTQVAERAGVPHLVPLGVTDEITERGFKTVFRLVNNGQQTGRIAGDQIRLLIEGLNPKPTSFALLHENTAFGSSLAPIEVAAMEAMGLRTTEVIPYSPTTTDLTTEITRIKAAKPDLLLANGYFQDGMAMARAIKEQRLDVMAVIGIVHGALSAPDFISQLGKDAEYYFSIGSALDPNDPRTAALLENTERRFGTPIENLGIQAYQMVHILADALERAASTDRDRILEALRTTKMENVVSPLFPEKVVEFDEKGQSKNVNLVTSQIQNGQLVNVVPAKYAHPGAKPIIPIPSWSARG